MIENRLIQRCTLLFLLVIGLSGCGYKSEPLVVIRERNNAKDLNFLNVVIQLPEEPLTLADIVAIACQRNLDILVKKLDYYIQNEAATGEMMKMLPSVIATGEYTDRNENLATRSILLPTPLVPDPVLGPASVNASHIVRRWDVTTAWNILDFSLAFYRSQAAENESLATYFLYERAKQNMILDIFRSYWKAMSARVGMEGAQRIFDLASKIQGDLEKHMARRNISQIQGLRLQDQLTILQSQLYSYEELYLTAKAELAALMGIPTTMNFELAPVEVRDVPEPYPISDLEEMALMSRPELYGADFDTRKTASEVKAAMAQFIPGINIFAGRHADYDRFLVHHYWFIQGVTAAWNLLAFPQYYWDVQAARTANIKSQEERLATLVGVLSQVNIAYQQYETYKELYQIDQYQMLVRDRLSYATVDEFRVGEFNILDVVSAQGNALLGEVAAMQAYGNLQVSLELINNSIGRSLYFNTLY